jgi:hypothetical protein
VPRNSLLLPNGHTPAVARLMFPPLWSLKQFIGSCGDRVTHEQIVTPLASNKVLSKEQGVRLNE